MATTKSRALKGYQGRDVISHRRYSFKTATNRFKRKGEFTLRGTRIGKTIVYGLGHKAGEQWGKEKQIDPESLNTKYSKNSPSFDEGVYKYKESKKQKALSALKE